MLSRSVSSLCNGCSHSCRALMSARRVWMFSDSSSSDFEDRGPPRSALARHLVGVQRPSPSARRLRSSRARISSLGGTESASNMGVRSLPGSQPVLLVLWDVDGTLVHTAGHGRYAFEEAYETVVGRPFEQNVPMRDAPTGRSPCRCSKATTTTCRACSRSSRLALEDRRERVAAEGGAYPGVPRRSPRCTSATTSSTRSSPATSPPTPR